MNLLWRNSSIFIDWLAVRNSKSLLASRRGMSRIWRALGVSRRRETRAAANLKKGIVSLLKFRRP